MADVHNPYQGRCLCGTVKFNITGPINDIIMCHCSLCRKAQGSAFATNANVAAEDFVFVAGEDNLSAYESTPGQFKYFCTTCGSPIISRQPNIPDVVRIRLGALDSDIAERPAAHIFVASKANWENTCDDLPHYSNDGDKRSKS